MTLQTGALEDNVGAILRVAVYCRVSTEKDIQENSYERQREYYRNYVDKNPNMTLVGFYGDFGKTGLSVYGRDGLQQLLNDCEAGKIDMILVKSLSRFTRSMLDCLTMVRRLRELHIPIVFEKEGINTMVGKGELMISIMAAIAQEESNSISENMRWSIDRHNAKGEPYYHPSYGFKRKTKGSPIWEVNETEAQRVRCAFDMAAEGRSYRDILQELNSMEEQEGTGQTWSKNRLIYLLKNIAYIGDYLTNQRYTVFTDRRTTRINKGERDQYYIKNHHAPIVSKETFERVQQTMRLVLEYGLLHSHPVYGYKNKTKGDPVWNIDENAAIRIRCAFEMAAAYRGYDEIIHALNDIEAKAGTGITWAKQRVWRTLRNVAYVGDYVTERKYDGYLKQYPIGDKQYLIEEHHIPLISREIFDQVQLAMSRGQLSSRIKRAPWQGNLQQSVL